MERKELEKLEQQYLMGPEDRPDTAPDRGSGSILRDLEDQVCLDFASGGGVNTLGCGSERWVNAVVEQAVKLPHSGPFLSAPRVRLAKALCERSGQVRVLLTPSGDLANDAMLRLARQYSQNKYGKGRGTVLTLENAWHGGTLSALSAGGLEGWDDGFRHCAPSMEAVEMVAGHDVCAVMLELVQSAQGIVPMDRSFVHDLAVLCAERDWLLLIDETGTAMGRTGTLFAYQQYGVLPDAVSFGSSIAGGLPLGGMLVNDKCARVLTGPFGEGASDVCCAAALAVLESLDESFLQDVGEKGDHLRRALTRLDVPCLGKPHGLGLMLGVEVTGGYAARELAARLAREGLLCLWRGRELVFLPPLNITREELDRALAVLRTVAEDLSE